MTFFPLKHFGHYVKIHMLETFDGVGGEKIVRNNL